MLFLIALLVVHFYPLAKEIIANKGDEALIVDYISSLGMKGALILIGLEVLQLIVAFIPEVLIDIMCGLCYGIWWGTLIGVAGITLGNLIVFIVMRQLKNLLAPIVMKKTKRKEILAPEMLARIKRPEIIVFFCFLMPFIPNGIIPFVFSQTKISLPKYLPATALGLIPSTFICALLGERIAGGDYTAAAVIAVMFLIIALITVIFRKRIMALITKENN